MNETQIYSKQATGDFPNDNAVSSMNIYIMSYYINHQVVRMIQKISEGGEPKMVTKTAHGNSCALL